MSTAVPKEKESLGKIHVNVFQGTIWVDRTLIKEAEG